MIDQELDFQNFKKYLLESKKFLSRKPGRPKETKSLKGRHFFLTVPHFSGSLQFVIDALKANQPQWQYIRYAAVKEDHKQLENDTHLHLYLGFSKQCRIKLDHFDYLGKHGRLERIRSYSNVLKYMCKSSRPIANFNYIEQIMRKDFPRAIELLLDQGYTIRQIYKTYSSIVASKNWSGYLRFLHYQKQSAKFQFQRSKPGICLITPQLIRARLTDQQYNLYYSTPIYASIVELINDIVRYGGSRPHKSKALFICGQPNTGKTTLGLALQRLVSTFTFPDDGWWQGYESDTFKMIMWNQFDLRRLAYPTLLKFLQGLRMDLPIKGSHVTRSDNPLIFLTSNLTLEELICKRFSSQQNRVKSRANLAVRIQQINIGSTPLFLLLNLLVSPSEYST